MKIDYYELPIVLDWSMVLLDGTGTCFVSEEGLLSPLKNHNLSKKGAENYLRTYLNVIINIIWITQGLPYGLTKGRLTNLIYIVDTITILLSWTDNENDELYFAVKAAYDVLRSAYNCQKQKYKIIKIPLPNIMIRTKAETETIDYNQYHRQLENQILVGSYTNLYVTNKSVLMPIYEDDINDQQVFEFYHKIFLSKKIIKINVRELILGNNNIDNIICPQWNI